MRKTTVPIVVPEKAASSNEPSVSPEPPLSGATVFKEDEMRQRGAPPMSAEACGNSALKSPRPPALSIFRKSFLFVFPSGESAGDRCFRLITLGFGLAVSAVAVLIAYELVVHSRLAWARFGGAFIVSKEWDPVSGHFGALPFIYGTLVSSFIAILIALPLGVGSAIFLAEMAPRAISDSCCFIIELLAAIPSVVLGLMGIFILVPMVRGLEPWLTRSLGFLPFFRGVPYGVGLLSAGVILALMILPYITVITREVLLAVPRPLKEGMLALGATHWETVWLVSIPYSRSGIIGSVFLSVGRALGETMAVTMVIGNSPKISWSVLDPAYTMAAVIANEMAEAVGDLHLHSLVGIGLILFGLTVLVNGAARLMIYSVSRGEI